MKISGNTNQYTPSHKGFWNNKTVLKGLEKISEHGTTFVAATTLAMAAGVRPIAINLTPNTKKENKEYATTNSIASGLIKFAMVEAIAIPVEKAVKNIDKTPEKFLSEKTIKTLQGSAKTLAESKNYKFATQVIKMSTGLLTAIPKAMLTVKRCIEQWYVWFFVNLLSLIMWIFAYLNASNCFATIIMWAVYLVLSIYFLQVWKKEINVK